MRNAAVLELVGSSLLELVDSSFEVVNSSSEVAGVVVGMALSAGNKGFPSEPADYSELVCRPPEVELSEAVEAAPCNWEAEADCNNECNCGARRWRLSSPGNWSWIFSLSE